MRKYAHPMTPIVWGMTRSGNINLWTLMLLLLVWSVSSPSCIFPFHSCLVVSVFCVFPSSLSQLPCRYIHPWPISSFLTPLLSLPQPVSSPSSSSFFSFAPCWKPILMTLRRPEPWTKISDERSQKKGRGGDKSSLWWCHSRDGCGGRPLLYLVRTRSDWIR